MGNAERAAVDTGPLEALAAVVRACATVEGPGVAETSRMLAAQRSGDILHAAANTRLLPCLGWWITTHRPPVPESLYEISTAAYRHWNARSTALREFAAAMGGEMERAGVRGCFRKGAHVSGLYPQPGCRPFSDLDVLAAADDTDTISELARRAGLLDVELDRSQRAYLRFATNTVPVLAGGSHEFPFSVDCAVGLLIPAYADRWAGGRCLSFAEVRTERVELGFEVLAPAFALVDLVVNTYLGATAMRYVNRMRFQRLTPYLDVRFARRGLTSSDELIFHEVVAEYGLEPAVRFVVTTERTIFGGEESAAWCDRYGLDDASADEFGTLEFGAPHRWSVPLPERLLLERLPPDLPAWTPLI